MIKYTDEEKDNNPFLRNNWFILVLLRSGTCYPANWGFQSALQCLKSVLRFICSLRWYVIIDISLHVLLQAAHTFCVSVLRVHVVLCVHVLSMCVPARLFTSDLAYIYIYHAHYRLVWNLRAVILDLLSCFYCLVLLLFLFCHFSANGPFSWIFFQKIQSIFR